jgi:hypothetical protein
MNIPEIIQTGTITQKVSWVVDNFEHHTWNSRDQQLLHLAEFFGLTPSGDWINLSVLNSGEEFVSAVIKAITTQ